MVIFGLKKYLMLIIFFLPYFIVDIEIGDRKTRINKCSGSLSVCLVYCIPPTLGGQAGNKKTQQTHKQSINFEGGAKYAAKKYLLPPSKMCGVTFYCSLWRTV